MKLLGIIRIVLRAKIFHETPSLFVQTQHGRSLFATENELSRVCTCTTSVYTTYKRARVPVGRRSNENPENAAQLVPRSVTKLLTWLDFRANEPENSSYAGEFRWLGPVAHVETRSFDGETRGGVVHRRSTEKRIDLDAAEEFSSEKDFVKYLTHSAANRIFITCDAVYTG